MNAFNKNYRQTTGSHSENHNLSNIPISLSGTGDIIADTTQVIENSSIHVSVHKWQPVQMASVDYMYVTAALTAAFFAFVFFVFFCLEYSCWYLKERGKQESNEGKYFSRSLMMDVFKSSCLCTGAECDMERLYFVFLVVLELNAFGNENLMRGFLYTFAIEKNNPLSVSEAATLNSLFWIGSLLGRILNIGAERLNYPLIFGITICIGLLNGIVLSIWGSTSIVILHIFVISFGVFNAPIAAASIVLANHYIEMSAFKIGLAYCGAALGVMGYQRLGGYLFESFGPESLMYAVLGGSTIIFVTYVIVQIMGTALTRNAEIKVRPANYERLD